MPDSHGRPKAADISDEAMLTAIQEWQPHVGFRTPSWYALAIVAMPQYPGKVVQAKLASLMKRGLAEGCTECSCWAWELTDAGRERIAVHA